jgi:hypothetical protein
MCCSTLYHHLVPCTVCGNVLKYAMPPSVAVSAWHAVMFLYRAASIKCGSNLRCLSTPFTQRQSDGMECSFVTLGHRTLIFRKSRADHNDCHIGSVCWRDAAIFCFNCIEQFSTTSLHLVSTDAATSHTASQSKQLCDICLVTMSKEDSETFQGPQDHRISTFVRFSCGATYRIGSTRLGQEQCMN